MGVGGVDVFDVQSVDHRSALLRFSCQGFLDVSIFFS